ncbi:MAG: peptidase M64, partial [Bacteroidaceae bacterium]|nr:peptidase M64 [Bacteroidaceae bacterium]
MSLRFLALSLFLSFSTLNILADNFSDWFYNKTMRFDYYHAGSATTEAIYFDEIIEEPYFAGSKASLIDDFGYGNYRLRIVDKASGKLIYQRGYDNLMKEWRTTTEAKTISKAMPESVVFPYPRKAVTLYIDVRNKQNEFKQLYSHDIDPESYIIRKSTPSLQTLDIAYQGSSEHCVDIVLIPEGYTTIEKAQFEKDCQNFVESLFSYAPYGDKRNKYNVRAVWAPSEQSGVSKPGEHEWKNTVCKVRYYTFYSERYQMTEDMQALRDIAANVPYDYIYIISNSQKYGGGAIYNW